MTAVVVMTPDELRALVRDAVTEALASSNASDTRKPVLTTREINAEYRLTPHDVQAAVRDRSLVNLGSPRAIRVPRWSLEAYIRTTR